MVDQVEARVIQGIREIRCFAFASFKLGDLRLEKMIEPELESTQIDHLATEALGLYTRALSLLELGMQRAREFWDQHVVNTSRHASPELNEGK